MLGCMIFHILNTKSHKQIHSNNTLHMLCILHLYHEIGVATEVFFAWCLVCVVLVGLTTLIIMCQHSNRFISTQSIIQWKCFFLFSNRPWWYIQHITILRGLFCRKTFFLYWPKLAVVVQLKIWKHPLLFAFFHVILKFSSMRTNPEKTARGCFVFLSKRSKFK